MIMHSEYDIQGLNTKSVQNSILILKKIPSKDSV